MSRLFPDQSKLLPNRAIVDLQLVEFEQRVPALLQLCFPACDAVLDGLGSSIFCRENGSVNTALEAVKTRMGFESVPDLLAEQALGELEDEGHGPRKVEKVDVSVPHWKCSLTATECFRNL